MSTSNISTANLRYSPAVPWLVLLGCIGFYSIPVGIMGNTAGIFVKPVMDEYGWSQTMTTMYRTIQPLVAAACTPFAAKILSKYSPRVILTLTTAVFGYSTMATGWATEIWHWNLYGVIYGITCAFFMYMAVPMLLNRWFLKNTGIALGIAAAVLSILAAFVSPFMQSLINNHGWRFARISVFAVATTVGVILCALFVKDSPEKSGVLPWGAKAGAENVAEATEKTEEKAEEGATPSQAYRTVGFYLVLIIAAIIVLTAAFFQQIPTYAARGPLGSNAGALAITIVSIGGIIGKLLLGWLCDQIGVKLTAICSMLAGAIGITTVYLAGGNVGIFYAGMCIFGIGYAGLTVIVPLLVRTSFGRKHYTEIFSWVNIAIFLATSLSFVLFGRIVDLTGSFDLAFFIVIGLYLVAAILIIPAINSSRAGWAEDSHTETKQEVA